MTGTSAMRDDLLDLIAKEGLVERDKLQPEATLESLNFASYDMVMILMAIEEKYQVYLPVDAEISEVKTLDGLLNLLIERITQQQKNPTTPPANPEAGNA